MSDPNTPNFERGPARGALKYPQIREAIRHQLLDGRFAPGTQLPTDQEFSRQLRVDRLTVSRALRELAEEGLVVRRRGSGTFAADAARPPLLPGQHLRIGLLWPSEVDPAEFDHSFAGEVTRGVIDHWDLADVAPDLPRLKATEPTSATWTSRGRGLTLQALGRPAAEAHRFPSMEAVRAGRFDALVSMGIIEDEWLELLLNLDIPTVLVDYPGERFNYRVDLIYADPLPAYRAAVAHLTGLGLTRIHYLGGLIGISPPKGLDEQTLHAFLKGNKRPDPDSVLRQHAYRVAMDEHGLAVKDGWVHHERLTPKYLEAFANEWAAGPEQDAPEAVVCFHYDMARQVQQAFAARGRRVITVGATHAPGEGTADVLPVLVDGHALAEAACTLVLARMQRRDRAHLRVGVTMKFNPGATGRTAARTATPV